MGHLTDNDTKAIIEVVTLLTLLVTLWHGNRRINRVSDTVDRQSHFNGNKSLRDGGSVAEALTRIEANSEQGRNETRSLRESMVTVSSRLTSIDNRLNNVDGRMNTLTDKMDHHIERTENAT